MKMMPKIITGFSAIIFIAFSIRMSDANDIEGNAVSGEKMIFEVR